MNLNLSGYRAAVFSSRKTLTVAGRSRGYNSRQYLLYLSYGL